MTTRTVRTARKSATPTEVPENLKGLVAEAPAPAPRSVRPARRTAAKAAPAPAPVAAGKSPRRRPVAVAVQSDALTAEAAPTILGANGELIRHTQDYTVDLLDPGAEPERDYAKVLAKSPSETHLDYVAWVAKYVGVEIDARTVQILISTYHEFQKTPEQKAKTIQKRLAAAQKRGEAELRKAAKVAK